MTKKKKEENIDINININDLKKEQCPECKGDGKVNNIKCPTCGGSGSTEAISNLPEVFEVQKGVPQNDYEVTVTDMATGKIVYKRKSFGGAMVSVDSIDKFTGRLTKGDYQCALWGNPLITRFGIDRLEETFAKNIDKYIEAIGDKGITTSNNEELKKALIEGFNLNLKKTLGHNREPIRSKEFSRKSFNPEEFGNPEVKNAEVAFLKVISDTMRSGSPFVAYLHKQVSSNDAQVDCILHKISLKKLILSALDFTVNATFKKTKKEYTKEDAKKLILKILEDLKNDINNNK